MPPLAYPNGPSAAPNIGSASLPYTTMLVGAPSAQPASAGQMTPAQWDKYLSDIAEAYKASSGWARTALAKQMEDAQKGRDNAYKIAELSASTSRYGVDQSTGVQLAQLRQNAQQFEKNHGLEIAKAYTQYASTPDQAFAMQDFKSALGRVGQGFSPAPQAETGTPHAKTYEDFAALSNYQNAGSGAAAGGAGATGGGTAPDARLKAMKAVGDAMPPSDGMGHDDQDWAAISAIKNLYFSGRPGEVERLGAPRRKIAQAGLARAGYDPATVEAERTRSLPGQSSVRAA